VKTEVLIFAGIVILLAGIFIGYYIKDNFSKPDITNNIRQRGRGNKILGFFKRNRKDTTSR